MKSAFVQNTTAQRCFLRFYKLHVMNMFYNILQNNISNLLFCSFVVEDLTIKTYNNERRHIEKRKTHN